MNQSEILKSLVQLCQFLLSDGKLKKAISQLIP